MQRAVTVQGGRGPLGQSSGCPFSSHPWPRRAVGRTGVPPRKTEGPPAQPAGGGQPQAPPLPQSPGWVRAHPSPTLLLSGRLCLLGALSSSWAWQGASRGCPPRGVAPPPRCGGNRKEAPGPSPAFTRMARSALLSIRQPPFGGPPSGSGAHVTPSMCHPNRGEKLGLPTPPPTDSPFLGAARCGAAEPAGRVQRYQMEMATATAPT